MNPFESLSDFQLYRAQKSKDITTISTFKRTGPRTHHTHRSCSATEKPCHEVPENSLCADVNVTGVLELYTLCTSALGDPRYITLWGLPLHGWVSMVTKSLHFVVKPLTADCENIGFKFNGLTCCNSDTTEFSERCRRTHSFTNACKATHFIHLWEWNSKHLN